MASAAEVLSLQRQGRRRWGASSRATEFKIFSTKFSSLSGAASAAHPRPQQRPTWRPMSDSRRRAGSDDPFFAACVAGDLRLVANELQRLGHDSAGINNRRRSWAPGSGHCALHGVTPFFAACWAGHLATAKVLVRSMGANPTIPDMNGRSPFVAACAVSRSTDSTKIASVV